MNTCELNDDFKHVCFKDLENYVRKDSIAETLRKTPQQDILDIKHTLNVQNIRVDSEIDQFSQNPVQNKAVYCALAEKPDIIDLSKVAYSGDYRHIRNTPTALPNPSALIIQYTDGTDVYTGNTPNIILIPWSKYLYSDYKLDSIYKKSTIKPDLFKDLGNNIWEYNYDIQEQSCIVPNMNTINNSNSGETITMYNYIPVRIQGKPTYDECFKAVWRKLYTIDQEIQLINDYNESVINKTEVPTQYTDYLHTRKQVMQQIKKDVSTLK